jgi:hypothetical protein
LPEAGYGEMIETNLALYIFIEYQLNMISSVFPFSFKFGAVWQSEKVAAGISATPEVAAGCC